MKIGGLQKSTLIDYPAKIAATVFTVGCSFGCPFCHNPELVLPEKIKKNPLIPEENFFAFLKKRRGLLEAVCISGGEPTRQPDLENFIEKIKAMGFLVKLDTNGGRPEVLKNLIKNNLVDYIAMDIKASLKKYPQIVKNVDLEDIRKSTEVVRRTDNYEFRSTVVPNLHTKEDLLEIGRWLKGSKKYFLQQFRPEKTIDSSFSKIKPYSEETLNKFCSILKPYFKICQVRI